MSTIYRKPTGVWYIQFVREGRRQAKSLGTKSKRAAREKQREFDEAQSRARLGLPEKARRTLRIDRCCDLYLEAVKDTGAVSKSSLDRASAALAILSNTHGAVEAGGFTARGLKAYQAKLKSLKLSRRTVNDYVGEVRRFFKWLASEDIIPASLWLALTSVEAVRRTDPLVENGEDVAPVSKAHVAAIRPHVPTSVWAMIQLQLHSAARPGEIVVLTPADIDTTGDIWVARPRRHKMASLGKHRTLYFGPEAQKVLRPYMERPPGECLFSPREAARERAARANGHRRPDQKPNPRVTTRRLSEHWTVGAYRKCVTAACDAAEIPRWTPHQLRHTAATEIRAKYGIEAAQVYLGHATLEAAQIYAEKSEQLAKKIAGEIG